MDKSAKLAEIAGLVERHCPHDERRQTLIRGLALRVDTKASRPVYFTPGICLAMVVRGEKELRLSTDVFRYGVGDYLVIALDVPVSSWITEPSVTAPHLGVSLRIEPQRLSRVIERSLADPQVRAAAPVRGVSVNRLSDELSDALLRLLRLLDAPEDISVLGPMIEDEILYRLLKGPDGQRLIQIASSNGAGARVAKAVGWLRDNFAQPLRVDQLADRFGMSVSSLHHSFKAVTAMTPIQFQKQLRLLEARRLMLTQGVGACSAGFDVGYQSHSQFSREYKRFFGDSPAQDLRRAEPVGRTALAWRAAHDAIVA